jgi:hypothetical protein
MAGTVEGAGESVVAEYDISDRLVLVLEQGFMTTGGPRVGWFPEGVIGGTGNGSNQGDPNWPAAFTNHVHAGLVIKGDHQIGLGLHYFSNWSQDDRVQRSQEGARGSPCDFPTTYEVNECYWRDGRIRTFAWDARMISKAYGVLGIGGSYIVADYAFPLKGYQPFTGFGDGERLTAAWLGLHTGGTGKVIIGGISYSLSVASLMLYPEPFSGQAPDIVIDAGLNVGKSVSSEAAFDDRVRHKYGAKVTYTFLPQLGAGMRFDRVVPSDKDPDQTFHVLNSFVQFKTNWTSRETITLGYVKWFLGPHTHIDGMNPRYDYEKIDEHLLFLNFNMWW